MTPVIVTERGAYLVMATDKREGDLSYDQVKTEIAAALAKDVWGKEAAKRDALEALAKAQAGKTLEQLFERAPVKGPSGFDPNMSPALSPEEQQRILEQLRQQQEHGSLELHEQDVPVAWYADADGSANGTTAAAGTAGGAAPAAGSATKGSAAAGSAAPGAGSGSAARSIGPPFHSPSALSSLATACCGVMSPAMPAHSPEGT